MSKKAVFFGAGSIGRGFLGQLLTEGGFEVVFVDVDQQLVDRLNASRSYPLCLLSPDGEREIQVKNVRAVHGGSVEAVAAEIANAELLGTSVGAGALKFVAPTLAAGLRSRWGLKNFKPIDVLLCENLMDADKFLHGLLEAELNGPGETSLLHDYVGLVETSIGRMVPVPSNETRRDNPLRVSAEPYGELPVDSSAFKGPIPAIPGLKPATPFLFYIQRKLFIHNLGHAVASYLGAALGYTWVWEAIGNPYILVITSMAMNQSARALATEHRSDLAVLQDHVRDLLARFANKALGDTLERVCKDPLRKLAPQDRLVGALSLCQKNNVDSRWIALGTAAALHFHTNGLPDLAEGVLAAHCQIPQGSQQSRAILEFLEVFKASGREGLLESLVWGAS